MFVAIFDSLEYYFVLLNKTIKASITYLREPYQELQLIKDLLYQFSYKFVPICYYNFSLNVRGLVFFKDFWSLEVVGFQ